MAQDRPKDKLKIKFNAIEGKFDLVQEFNADRILTHSLNEWGNPFILRDNIWGVDYEAGDQLVTDSNGNVLVI